jgi:type VI secretion system protein ImpJ
VSVSPFVVQLLRRVTEILSSKSGDLAGQQRKTGGMAEAARFWLLHTMNSHLPALLHCYHQERVHPEQVFLELVGLAAELCSFAGHEHPRDLPVYDHDDLSQTFGLLGEKLQFLLDTVIPTHCVELPLESTDNALFSCRVRDASLLREAQFYIAVGADEREDKMLVEIPAKTKISSREKVQDLIAMAMRGVQLRHVANPPAEIPVQPGRLYYKLEKFGPHWEAIEAAGTISIHIPPDFNDLRLELLAVKD